jgi:hypothetical protein
MTTQKLIELNNASIAASAAYGKAYDTAQEAVAYKQANIAYDAFVAAKAQYESELAAAAAKNNALSSRIDKATFTLESVLMLQGHNFNAATVQALQYVLATLNEVSKCRT